MKPEQIMEALSYVDEELLLDSENGKGDVYSEENVYSEGNVYSEENKAPHKVQGKAKILHWSRWGSLAACACLAIVIFAVSGPMFFGGSGASSSSSSSDSDSYYDSTTIGDFSEETAEEAAEAAAEGAAEAAGEAAADNKSSAQNTESASGYTTWVACDGYEYDELSEDELTEYGIPAETYDNIPETDIGESIGIAASSNDSSLTDKDIYRSVTYEDIYIVETTDGYRYFRQIQL